MAIGNRGNKDCKGKSLKLGTELAQRIRGAILNTFEALELKEGPEVLSDTLMRAFKDNPLKFLDTAAKFVPKDISMELVNTLKASNMTDSELSDIIAERARERRTLEGELAEDEAQAIDIKEDKA